MSTIAIGTAVLHHGDCRHVLAQAAAASMDVCITDPPYGDTSLDWDRCVDGWIEEVARVLRPNASLWIFGSMRFLAPLFAQLAALGFKYSQDIVWEKQNGTGFHADRFRRVHEHAVLFYRGAWADVYHDTQYTLDAAAKTVRRKTRPAHTGHIDSSHYVSEDGGPRMMRSVVYVPNEHGRAIHPTQKPVELIRAMVRYSVAPGGCVVDPFMGSGSTAIAAYLESRTFVGIEKDARYFPAAAARIDQIVNPNQSELFARA